MGGLSNWTAQVRAIKRMTLPTLPRRRRTMGEVWGVSVVRDEKDVLEAAVKHLFDQGIAHVLIADNRSTDGTREHLLEWAAADARVHVALDEEPAHIQSQKMTWLAHCAWRAGADWIVPFDADEFWFAPEGSVAERLRLERSAGVVHASFHHMVPVVAAPADLSVADFMLDCTSSFPGKVALRSHPLAWVGPGNHAAARVGGESVGLAIAHAQYRSPAQVARKVRQGTAAARLTGKDLDWFSPHWAAASGLSDAEIQDVWDRISAGLPDDRIQFRAAGPMLRLRPLTWATWDPDGEIARAQGGSPRA
ncbi:MAG: glycosyltransferase family 2 protein [Actinobacteria bacterium]|jgi:Glycosyltransferases involved in cell wall biogenesis|nr:glycosyltransferase family 2 protein [Actinomycetota bacterium]